MFRTGNYPVKGNAAMPNFTLHTNEFASFSAMTFESASAMGLWLREAGAVKVAVGVWKTTNGYAAQTQEGLEDFLSTLEA
jgi:hypothetical protein